MSNKISEHFLRAEFACRCGCGQDTVDAELITILENLRKTLGGSITIHSGNRCEAYNKKIDGAKNSQHVRGRAADIGVEGFSPRQVQDAFDRMYPDKYGMGRYDSFTHVDSRYVKARWGE